MNNPNSMLMDQLSRYITQALVMGGDKAITNHQATNRLEEIVNCLPTPKSRRYIMDPILPFEFVGSADYGFKRRLDI